jgi:hypothetical protein
MIRVFLFNQWFFARISNYSTVSKFIIAEHSQLLYMKLDNTLRLGSNGLHGGKRLQVFYACHSNRLMNDDSFDMT